MSTGIAPAVSPVKQVRIGSFSIVERLNPPDAIAGQITLKVVGAEDTSFAGREAIATCFNAPQTDEARERVDAMLASLKNLVHPSIWPVMEVGSSSSVTYWIRSMPTGDSLDALPHVPSIRDLGAIALTIASGLQAAHDRGLSHGSIRSGLIRTFPSGAWTLYGLGIMGRGPANDQFDLARVLVAVLSGRTWQEPDGSGYPENERAYHRSQRLREQLNNSTERVVNVVNRAMHLDAAQRYPSISEFAEDLVDQIRISGDDLVHGAFEAISARNTELARVMAAKAAIYNPESDNLAVLNVQLNGGSAFAQSGAPHQPYGQSASPFTPPTSEHVWVPVPPQFDPDSGQVVPGIPMGAQQPPAVTPSEQVDPLLTLAPMPSQTGSSSSAMPAELAQGLPPEMVEMFAAQFQQATPKKGINPMFVLILGGLGMVVLLLVAALVTFFASGA